LKILIELPTWLGDTVMTTPAIESIFDNFPQFKLQLVGQKTSLEVYKNHPKIDKLFEISDKYIQYFSLARKIGNFDIFVSFRNTFRSRIFRKLIKASKKYSFNKGVLKGHQVEQYQNLINYVMDVNLKPGKLKLYQSSVIQITKLTPQLLVLIQVLLMAMQNVGSLKNLYHWVVC